MPAVQRTRQAASAPQAGRTGGGAPLVERVGALAARELAPLTGRIDREGLYPEALLRSLGAAGAFSAHVAPGAGGLGEAIGAIAEVGRRCLATAFCAWCQDALAWYLRHTANAALRARLLGPVASGAILGGTGLSNPLKALAGLEPLRLSGRAVPGGFRVSGALPWVSNLGPRALFGTVFAAGGRRVAALVDCAAEGVTLSPLPRFVALEGTRTAGVRLDDAFTPEEQVLADPAEPFLARVRAGFVLLQAGMAFGVIRGSLEVVARCERRSGGANRFLPDQPDQLTAALERLERTAGLLARTPLEETRVYSRSVLQARLEAGELALRAAQSAVLHAGATGYLAGAPAERLLREACFVAIVTPSLKHLRMELAAPDEEAGRGPTAVTSSAAPPATSTPGTPG